MAGRSQAEELGLSILTHCNAWQWGGDLDPRTVVCTETEAHERFLSRLQSNESVAGLDSLDVAESLDALESSRHQVLTVHECAWKNDEFIVRKNPSSPFYPQWANYRKNSAAEVWDDGIVIRFYTLERQGVASQDTEVVPVADFLRSKRDSTATTTAQETTSSG